MEDDYSHIDNTHYVWENIPGPIEHSLEHVAIVEGFNSQLLNKCNCLDLCVPPECLCNRVTGDINYIMCSESSKLKLNIDKMKDGAISPIVECNDLCSCSANCGNRLVQKGPLKSLYIKICSSDKGLGLFSTNIIPKHTFVCEYAGEVITRTQAEIRHESNKLNHKMNYIFCLNEHSNNKVIQTLVDPSEFGNIGRYVNHSCDPNCVIMPVRVNTAIPKLAIFSCVDILPHTEITFDYGSNSSANFVSETAVQTKCLCNTAKCVGQLPYQMY